MAILDTATETRSILSGPKIRDEVLEDAVTLGGMGFSAHFGQRDGGWSPVNRLCGRYFSCQARIFESFRHRYARGGSSFGFQEHDQPRDHDVSGMAPPSRMMLAQRSRIAANMSNMAAPICKKICRPWRTILPAV